MSTSKEVFIDACDEFTYQQKDPVGDLQKSSSGIFISYVFRGWTQYHWCFLVYCHIFELSIDGFFWKNSYYLF